MLPWSFLIPLIRTKNHHEKFDLHSIPVGRVGLANYPNAKRCKCTYNLWDGAQDAAASRRAPEPLPPSPLCAGLLEGLQRTGRGGVQTSPRNLVAASVVRWVTGASGITSYRLVLVPSY